MQAVVKFTHIIEIQTESYKQMEKLFNAKFIHLHTYRSMGKMEGQTLNIEG